MQDQIRKLSKTIHQINGLFRRVEHQMNLNIYEARVLYALHIDKLQTQKEIVEQYEMPKQTINNFISALHKQGYLQVMADENDHRQKKLLLTETGYEYASRTLSPLLEFEEEVASRLSPGKFEMLLTALEDYYIALEEVSGERKDKQ